VTLLTALLTVCLAAAPLAAQDWVGRSRMAGQVLTEDGDPIEGATVTIWLEEEGRGPEPAETKDSGRFGFLGIKFGVWTVVVEKEGFLISEGQFQVGSASKPLQIRMKTIPEEMLYNQRALEAKKLLEEGNALLGAGDYEGARAKYREGMEGLDVAYHGTILLAVANAYTQEGNAAEAMKTLEQARAVAPDNPEVLLALARCHYDGDEIDQAIARLEELLEVQPDNETALQVISDMLVAEGRVDEAQAYLARLGADAKVDPNAILNVGIDHYNAGEMDEAFSRFDQVVSEYPDMAMGRYYRGLIYLSRGENDLAKADLEAFLTMEPDSPKASEAKEFLSYIE
jgi:tetratricopeptide (TPR) repeat protein